jgi:hypothetical protein
MKQTFFGLFLFILLVACNNHTHSEGNNKILKESDTVNNSNENKTKLIEELLNLKLLLNSNNREKIASIFEFPKSNQSFKVVLANKDFNEKMEFQSNIVTAKNFVEFYDEISSNIWLKDITYLLNNLPLESLLHKDKIVIGQAQESKPCFSTYQIHKINDSITLRVNVLPNKNFKISNHKTNVVDENPTDYCEHSYWWSFKFDGSKLHFSQINGVG